MTRKSIGRVFIIDPSLRNYQGHHFTLTKKISDSSKLNNFEPVWVVSKQFKIKKSGVLKDINIKPVLGISMYDAYQSGTEKLSSPEEILTKEILDTLSTENAGSRDRILFHTADGMTYLAIPKIIEAFKHSCPVVHICTPYDPVGVMPNRVSASAIALMIDKLVAENKVGKIIHFYGENELLSKHLSELWNIPVHTLSLPANQHKVPFSRTNLIQYRRVALGISPRTFLCTYLGAARLEKGYHYLPYIISRTFEYAGEVPPIHFAIQSSPQVIGYNETVKNAIMKIKQMPRHQVTLIDQVLKNEEYSKLLHASNLVLLPYEKEKYRVRGSGIVSEAIEAGKIVLGTTGTYPGAMGEKYVGGSALEPKHFAKKILKFEKSKGSLEREARNLANAFIEKNRCENYIRKCLDVEARGV